MMSSGFSMKVDLSASDIKHQLKEVINYKCEKGITTNKVTLNSTMIAYTNSLEHILPKDTGAMREGMTYPKGKTKMRHGQIFYHPNPSHPTIEYDPYEERDNERWYYGDMVRSHYPQWPNFLRRARQDKDFLKEVKEILQNSLRS
jgi:hypothetical protein